MSWLADAAQFIVKVAATPIIEKSKELGQLAKIGLLTMAAELEKLKRSRLIGTFEQLKTQKLKEWQKSSDAKIAESERKIAEATAAANSDTLAARQQAKHNAEMRIESAKAATLEAEAEIKLAEAEKIRSEVKLRQRVNDAVVELKDKVSILRQHGGDLIIDESSLNRLLSSADEDEFEYEYEEPQPEERRKRRKNV